MKQLIFIMGICGIIANPASADIYKCTGSNGVVTFSQMPCGHDAKKIQVETAEPTAAAAAQSRKDIDSMNKTVAESAYQRQLQAKRNRIQELIDERDRKLSALRYKKQYANNNLAGATWEKSISDEMQAVTMRYSTDIANARSDLHQLEKEHSASQQTEKSEQ